MRLFRTTVFRRLAPIFLWTAALAAAPITYNEQLDPNLFGSLNQHDTICGAMGCGPTAALNSLVYLENRYPNTYGHDLVPVTGTDQNGDGIINRYDDWIAAANELA